jgi:hypothetical protein
VITLFGPQGMRHFSFKSASQNPICKLPKPAKKDAFNPRILI